MDLDIESKGSENFPPPALVEERIRIGGQLKELLIAQQTSKEKCLNFSSGEVALCCCAPICIPLMCIGNCSFLTMGVCTCGHSRIQRTRVPSASMAPTLNPGEYHLLRLLWPLQIAWFLCPSQRRFERGEVVAFNPPPMAVNMMSIFHTKRRRPSGCEKCFYFAVFCNSPVMMTENSHFYNIYMPLQYVKRVVAVDGDTVEILNGVVLVNGAEEVTRSYRIAPRWSDGIIPRCRVQMRPKMVVPPNHVYVLGDNRENSFDSSYWLFVPNGNIKSYLLCQETRSHRLCMMAFLCCILLVGISVTGLVILIVVLVTEQEYVASNEANTSYV